MPAIFFALISYLGWGIGDIFGTIASRRTNGYVLIFWSSIIGLVISSFYIPFAWKDLQYLTKSTLVLLIVLEIISPLPIISLFEGLRIGSAPVVGSIAASFAALTVVLSLIFLGERVSTYQTVALLTIFAGVFLVSFKLNLLKSKNLFADRGIPFAFITMILGGIYLTFIKIPIKEIGWFWPMYFSLAMFPVTYLIIKIRKIRLSLNDLKDNLFTITATSILLNGAALSYNLAISLGQVAIVAPIAGSYPTLFVMLAFFIFKDPITRQQIVGIVTTLIGIVALSFLSV